MKAIHNSICIEVNFCTLFSILQRYKMKAIHNCGVELNIPIITVFNTSKIQNESNSQPVAYPNSLLFTVFNTSKIQNESNSQPFTED